MNKLCYRLIFSRLHGELRVVAELARRGGARSGLRRGIGAPRLWVTVRRTVWMLGAALLAGAAVADGIVPDGNVAPDQRPEVIATRNGLPQVNITAPNQAGISHNQYQQFDVDPRGAILNNSAVMTSTQMAGIIQGNPNLNPHAAPAQVILNEVNSHHPSQLRGFMEVAGGQAQVIIANPAGIVCNGCGTINAGRMTLTTGKPQLNADGSLAGYQVERGVVRVEGEGLNANNPHDTRYVDILARAVKINAGVWAKERLSVIAGRNSVSADGNAVRPLAEDTSAKPLLAIDMGQMGGMYSGHIRMIGTEAGVGVRSRNGRLGGDKTLTVSCDGKLSWQSTAQEAVTQAGGDVILAARDAVSVHGKLHSGGQLSVQSREGALTQSGTLAAAGHVSLVAARGIKSRGHLLAGSDVDSHVVHEGNLTLASQGEIRASGRLLSKKDVIATGRGIDISGAKVAASRTTLIARQDGVVMRQAKIDSAALAISAIGDIDAQRAQVLAGHWEVDANHLFNQKAVWSQTVRRRESRFTLAGKLDNSDGAIESRQLEFVAAALTNQRGRLVALDGEGQYWRANGPLDNTGGALASGGNLTLKVGSLTNQDGAIKALAALKIHTDGDINNAKGMLIADNAVELEALGTLDNQTGQITGGQMYLAASRLNNAQGEVVSQGRLGLTALRGLDNPGGWLEARGILSVYTHGEWDNRGGIVQGGSLAAAARALNNAGGRLQSRGDLTLDGIGDIINAAGILTAQQALTIKGAPSDLLDNDGGSLQSGGALTLQGGRLTNRQSGWVLSQQGLALDLAGSLDNQSGTVTGHGLTRVRAASLHNHQGVINALDTLDMAFTGALDNGGGRIFSKLSQTLQARDIVNRQGWVGSQGGWSAVSGGFDNAEGRLQSGEALMLDAQTLNNAGGTVDAQRLLALRIPGAPDDADVAMRGSGERQTAAAGIDNRRGVLNSGGGLDLAAAQLDNAGGTLISQGASNYRVGEFNNQQGKVHSADALTLDGIRVNNQGGQSVSTHALQIRANALDNSDEGILSSQAALEVQVGRLNNRNGGLILGSSRISITGRDIDNTAGRVQSAGPLTLVDVARLDNRRGHILANGALDIVTESSPADALLALLNQGGRLESDCALTLHARNLDNQGGTLLGRQALTLSAQQGYSHHADETISSNGTVTFSLSGAFHNLADWLLPGHLVLNAARVSNPAHLVAKTIQLTTGALQNSGRLEAGVLTLHADTLDNTAALMGDDIAVRGRIIDHHGQPAVMAATRNLSLHAGERLSNRDGALIYSGDRLSLRSDDVIENRASFIEADGDVTVDARRLDNLREGLVIGRDVEKNDYKWHRYNYYWRSYGSRVNRDKNTMTSTTQHLTFQDDNAAQTNRYGTLMAIDAAGKRALVRLKDRRGRMTDLWVNYLALQPNVDGSYAMRFYETRGFRQNGVPTPYHNTVWREHDRGRIEQWDPARHVDIDNAPFIRDYSNFRERTATGTVRRDVLINDGVGTRLLAGGNVVLRITGQLLNDASVVTANGNLMQDGGGNVDNRGYSINARRQEFIVDHMDKDTVHWYPTHNLDETTALSTVDGVITGNGNVSINGARITHTTVNQAQISQREAALAAVDIERAEFERNPLAFTVNGVDVLTGDTPPAPGSQIRPTGLGLPSPLGRRLLPAERALTALQHLERVAMSIPNNSLFSQRLAPGSPFLVETDERFIRRDKFMSSDYLLNRVGYDPARVHKRLGDGFYEQRLVRMQMQALVGTPTEEERRRWSSISS